jgi:hypothetical protein
MAGLLDDGSAWDIDPSLLATMASDTGTPTWTPSPADQSAAADQSPDVPPQTMATTQPDSSGGGGFWGSLAGGLGDAGAALGGGVDPSITGPARTLAGNRALLNFGLSMLMNSGPSYTPRNFGQILGAGLGAASESTLQTEQNRLKAQQIGATLALKAGQLKIQELLALGKGAKMDQALAAKKGISDLAGSGGGAPADSATAPIGAAPASAADFVSQNAPVFQDVATRTGLPVEFVAGQAGNESAWGTSPAAVQGNNLFGILDHGKPASYPTKQAGVDAYVALLNGKYANVPRTGSAADIGAALGAAGYDTVDKDYGQRIGNFAAQAAPLLPRPTTTGPTGAAQPGTMVAGPGAGAAAPPGGAVAPGPSSTPPSAGTAVFGPGSPDWQTLPPPVLPDQTAARAKIEDTYQRQLQAAKASGSATDLTKANQDRLTNLAALDKQNTDMLAAHQKAEVDLNEARYQKQQDIQAENQRNILRIQADNDRAAAERAHQLELERVKNGYTVQQRQVEAEQQTGSKQFEAMGTAAQNAEKIQPMVRDLIPLLKNAPSGALGQVLSGHPEWVPALAAAGIVKPETATAAQLINGLTDYLSLDLKPTGTGALRSVELPLLKGLAPSLAQSPQAQQQALARILNYTQRVKDEYDFVGENFGKVDPATGQPNYKIQYKNIDAPMQLDENGQRVGGGLGPVVPEPPPLSPNPTPKQQAAALSYTKYVANLPSGMPYNIYEKQQDGTFQRVLKVKP